MKQTAVVMLQLPEPGSKQMRTRDVEVPLHIAAERVIRAIAETYDLPEDVSYLICEDPIALLCGGKTLEQYGVHDGSTLRYMG